VSRDRGTSGETYIVYIDGEGSRKLDRDRALERGKHNGETLRKDVKVVRLRPGMADVTIAAWKDGRKTK
jgi:hypothetical protein